MTDRRRSAAHVLVDDLHAPVLDDADIHHLMRVLRVAPGRAVTVTDGRGGWRSCVLGAAGVVEPTGDIVVEDRPDPEVAVGFVVAKGDRPEWVVQKLTELGIDRIVPMHSARSVVRWDTERAVRNVERLRRVAREALMQSRQVWAPVVEDVVPFHDAVRRPGAALAEPGGAPPGPGATFLLVGPEGGFTPEELASGVPTVSLPGSGILRAETAALAAGVVLAQGRSAPGWA